MLDFLLFDDAKLNITRCTSEKKHFARLAKQKLTYIFSFDITAFQNVKDTTRIKTFSLQS
jgi:hypothetical protein